MSSRPPPAGGYKLPEFTSSPSSTKRPVGAAASARHEETSPPAHVRAGGRARAAANAAPPSSTSSIAPTASPRSLPGASTKPSLKRERSGSIPHNLSTISTLSQSVPSPGVSPAAPVRSISTTIQTMAGSLSPRADTTGPPPSPPSEEKDNIKPEDRVVVRTNSATKSSSITRTGSSSAEEEELARLVCSDTEGVNQRPSKRPSERASSHTSGALFSVVRSQPIPIQSRKDLQKALRESQLVARIDCTILKKREGPIRLCAKFCKKHEDEARIFLYQVAALALIPTGAAASWADRLTFLINLYDELASPDHKKQLIEAIHQLSLENEQLKWLLDRLKGLRGAQLFLGSRPGFVERLMVRQVGPSPLDREVWCRGAIQVVCSLGLAEHQQQHLLQQVREEQFCKGREEEARLLLLQLAALALTQAEVEANPWNDRLAFLIDLYELLSQDHGNRLIEAVHQLAFERKQLMALLERLKTVRGTQLFASAHLGFAERLIVRQVRLPPKSALTSARESWRRGDEGEAWRNGTILFVCKLSRDLESPQQQELVRQVESESCGEVRDLILNLIYIELNQITANNQLLVLFRGDKYLAAALLRGYFDVRLNAMYNDLIILIDRWRRGSPPAEEGERERQETLLRSLLSCIHERKHYTAVVEMLRSLRELLQPKVAQWNEGPDDQRRTIATFLHSFLCLRSINLMFFDRLGLQDPIAPKLAKVFQLLGDPEPRTPREEEESWAHACYAFGKVHYSSHRDWLLDLSEREEEAPPEPDQAPE